MKMPLSEERRTNLRRRSMIRERDRETESKDEASMSSGEFV